MWFVLRAGQAMMGQIIGSLLSVVLDPIMILGFGWNIAGAAIATVIGGGYSFHRPGIVPPCPGFPEDGSEEIPVTAQPSPQGGNCAVTGISSLEATPGFEPGNRGFADPCLTTWLCRHIDNRSNILCSCYPLWSGRRGSNPLPPPWQGGALPDELRPRVRGNAAHLVPPVGIEPTTRGFSVRCSTN